MKINVKTLKGTDFFEITLEETATVNELKDKIAADKSKEKDTIKLVHKGKQLNDDTKTLAEVGIKENDFIILMVFAKKAEKQDEPAKESATTTASTTSENKPSVPAASNVQPSQVPTTSATTTSAASNLGEGSELLQGAELEEKVKEMEDMGFERPKIMQALKAAYYNPERAVDYLLSGNIPSVSQGPIGGGLPGQAGQGRPSSESLQQLAQLTQNPQFQQIAQAIRSNPALLQPVMAQLAQSNPEVAQLIQQNPQAFIQLLLGIGGGGQQGGQLPRNAIQVTPEEKADIEEIISLGFDKNDALEAYISCDKNKELAINYLFDAKDSGALLSEHIHKEQEEAAQQESAQQTQPPANQNNPQNPSSGNNNNNNNNNNNPPSGDSKKDKDDEDDFMYQ